MYTVYIYIYIHTTIYIYAQRLGFAWKHKSFFWPRLLRRKAWVKNMCHWTGAHTSQICYHNIPTYTNVESEVREIYVNSIRLLNGWMEWPRNFWTHMDAVDSTSWLLGLLPNPQLALTSGKRCISCRESESVKTQSKYGTFWENSLKKIRIPIDTSVVSQHDWHPRHFPRVLQSVVVTKQPE